MNLCHHSNMLYRETGLLWQHSGGTMVFAYRCYITKAHCYGDVTSHVDAPNEYFKDIRHHPTHFLSTGVSFIATAG